MKKVYIIHGWGMSPNQSMIKWLKKSLEEKEFQVIAPQMPNTDEPEINAWVNTLKDLVESPNEDTYFIGHSIGCQTILRYLEKLSEEIKVGGMVLISPWFNLQGIDEEEGSDEIAKPWVETPIDFEKVNSHIDKVVCIFSDNDPYVPLTDKELFKERLNAKIIVEHNKGHFGESDGTKDNPTALNELLKIST